VNGLLSRRTTEAVRTYKHTEREREREHSVREIELYAGNRENTIEDSVVRRKREIELYAGNRENTIEDSVVRRKRDRKSNRWYISIITNHRQHNHC